MSLSRETVLFGIALIVFATWIEVAGLGGWPFAVTGIGIAALGLLGSLASASSSPPATTPPVENDEP